VSFPHRRRDGDWVRHRLETKRESIINHVVFPLLWSTGLSHGSQVTIFLIVSRAFSSFPVHNS
jgi:hypothetical protein